MKKIASFLKRLFALIGILWGIIYTKVLGVNNVVLDLDL